MKISRTLLNRIEGEALAAAPREACGLLTGRAGGNDILDAIPSPNLAEAPNHFLIDPAVHLEAQRKLREKGLTIIGIYHSHPSGESFPSNFDKIGAKNPGWRWLIIALNSQKIAKTSLFREINDKKLQNERNFVQEPLQINEITG